MSGRATLTAGAAGLVALVAAGFAVDSYRLASAARAQVRLADVDLARHEQRLAKLLGDFATVTPEVRASIAAYEGADAPAARRDAYAAMVGAFRRTMADNVDPDNPLNRRFMDDVAGTINRHEVAEEPYERIWGEYQLTLAGIRGAIARTLSSEFAQDLAGTTKSL